MPTLRPALDAFVASLLEEQARELAVQEAVQEPEQEQEAAQEELEQAQEEEERGEASAITRTRKSSTRTSSTRTRPSTRTRTSTDGSARVRPSISWRFSGEQNGTLTVTTVDEPLSVLSPITGVMRAAQLSLIEAAVVTNLPDMNVHGFAATEFAGSVPDNPHGLQVDLMAAITLYTMESELYPKLNRLLRNRERERLKPFFPYLKKKEFTFFCSTRSRLGVS